MANAMPAIDVPLPDLPSAAAVRESQAMSVAGRAGMVTRGVVHLLIAALTVEVVRGHSTEEAGTEGALAAVARQPLGRWLTVLIAVGALGYAIWRLLQAAVGRADDDPWWKRASAAARGLLWLGIAGTAARMVVQGRGDRGRATGGGGGKEQATAAVLGWPGGSWLIAAAGLAVLGVAAYNGYRAATTKFEDHLELDQMGDTARAVTVALGVAGHAGRFIAYTLVGGLLVVAAVQHDPSGGGGLDVALRRLASTPVGGPVLLALAAGLAAFGLFQLLEARYRDPAD